MQFVCTRCDKIYHACPGDVLPEGGCDEKQGGLHRWKWTDGHPRFVQIAASSTSYKFGSEVREAHTVLALDTAGDVWIYNGLDKEDSAARWVRLSTARALPKGR